MERVYLHINIPNMISVGVMMLVWFWLYGFAVKSMNKNSADA